MAGDAIFARSLDERTYLDRCSGYTSSGAAHMFAIAGHVRRPADVHTREDRVSLGFRLRAWWHRAALDGQLAAGTDPATSEALERRAAQITTAESREALAVGLDRILEAAEEPPFSLSSSAPLRRAEVLASRGALTSLARELRRERPVRAQGVALTRRLLTDVRSPLYAAACAEDVERAAREARDAL